MERHKIESTVIDAVGYARVLEIRFESGRIYQYYDVPAEIFDAMLAAPSKGQYFNAHIRGKYSYQEITLKDRAPRKKTATSKGSTRRNTGATPFEPGEETER